ncbi:MSHA biogenesis protein MshK [Photobacterium sp. MCCC 1A19761]|uniref:MSHA biogenesis protein MshK n=1 Tax=Photobacterium sp. MCCC 1A19761 TaxID=3115000 RepID=UPI00307DE4D3
MVKAGLLGAVVLAALAGPGWAAQDPTAPFGWQAPAQTKSVVRARLPQLQAVVCGGPGGCLAILNNAPVALGERISGYTLADIREGTVTLSRGEKRWRLEVFADDIKTND